MAKLQGLNDIKIPYPIEGIIRTAQIDDTTAPTDSVELAINMNFDRVGATQTRPGVTQYADDLDDEIKNYGTLRNSIVSPGYASLFQLGTTNELIDDVFTDPAIVPISNTKVAVFWKGVSGDGFCQNFSINEETGVMNPIGTAVEFDTSDAAGIKAISIGQLGLVLVVWTGPSGDGFARVFGCGSDTIVPGAAALEFDTADGINFTLAQVDSTHFICFYTGTSDDGIATIFAVNIGTQAVTEPGSPLTFESGTDGNNSCVAVGDGTRFINFWQSGSGGKAQCFSVNTGTWAITAIGSALTFDTTGAKNNALSCLDGQHFVNVFVGSTSDRNEAQAFNLNLSTYAVTEVGTSVIFSPTAGNDLNAVGLGDGQHFLAFYSLGALDGYAQMLEMNPSTFNMSMVGQTLSGFDFANGGYTTSANIGTAKVLAVWGNGQDLGQSAVFESFGLPVNGRWLYAASGDEVFNTSSTTWTSRRSGLAEVSKPRFSQYLGYIWMVDGNELIGGDPVATSNGGAFGTDLVPDNFPAGDFIHAGFEGRVWVGNKTLGTIYYTDIVQFVPPLTYILTYNPLVNFITTIAPQTGQTMTALYRVPRALLVFTEDTITRIYGASSIDAYPAYNVGTYSQESIVETKTGIFFHHSSGFYQFDYGSQPVEISRRIIDFVKAIPRTYYDDITGVWDGLDNIEWNVGTITVDGITIASCVLRYTISTQVWTVYDYLGNEITAMIYHDDGTYKNHLMGTAAGKTGSMDVGVTDFGNGFYYEFIDRWRSYTEMYYVTKSCSGFNVYNENAAGANLSYQPKKSGPNAWIPTVIL